MLSLKSPYASVKKDCSNFFSAAGFIGISPNVQSSLCRAAESISAINSEMQPIFSRSVFAEMPTNCTSSVSLQKGITSKYFALFAAASLSISPAARASPMQKSPLPFLNSSTLLRSNFPASIPNPSFE